MMGPRWLAELFVVGPEWDQAPQTLDGEGKEEQ